MGTVEQRLQVLEHQWRRSRRMNRALAVAIVAIGCIAAAQGNKGDGRPPMEQKGLSDARPPATGRPHKGDPLQTLTAGELVLVDRRGRSRAKMQVTDEGPAICLFDEDGRKRLELSHTKSGSGLRLLDSGETPVVSLQLPQNENPAHLEIRSAQGSSLTRASGLSVRDAADRGRLHVELVNGNFPLLGVSGDGQNGPPSIEMTAGEGTRSFKIHDQHGRSLFSVSAADDGGTSLNIGHPLHDQSLQISTGPRELDGPVMTFLGPAKGAGSGGLLPRLELGFGNDREPRVRIVGRDGRARFAAPAE